MSKIYNKYIELKSNPNYIPNTLFLFKSGLFFIFIDQDAKLMSNSLNLKLSMLNNDIVKCGFPINSFQKYYNLIKNTTPYNVEIVSLQETNTISSSNYLAYENSKNIIDDIINTNIENLSISEAYEFLNNIKVRFKNLYK